MKGLNNSIKRNKVFAHLVHLKADIIFVQETHLRTTEALKLKRKWMGDIFLSGFNSKSRGTAIIIRKCRPWVSNAVILDKNGRFTIVSVQLLNKQVILACVYAPNWDDSDFVNNFFSSLPEIDNHLLIIGGDINCVI